MLSNGLLALATLILLISGSAFAADVSISVSQRETYVNLPVVLRIRIDNASNHDPPELPEVDGLKFETAGPPSRSSQISVINGQTAQNISSVTYSYRVTPTRAGEFTIPPITISAGGKKTITKAVRIVASKSDTNDLLFVEISGAKQSVYVGQQLDLTLKIWVRPYRSKKYDLTLGEENMWQLLSDQTSWGIFADRIEQLAKDRKRPGGELVLRPDSDGNEREYLLYEIDAQIYPDRPGQIDGDDVVIIFNYPESLSRSRSPFSMFDDDPFFRNFGGFSSFGSRLAVEKVRPITAEAMVDSIDVKPIPTDGRPDNYRGAIGRYSIATKATPTVVQAGDPITLQIEISGSGPLDVVRAPALSQSDDLARDFKVADDKLSGIVDGSSKRFTTTIRPTRPRIEQIPPIEFSYFDPDSEQFVTARSKPIAIEVGESEQLDLASVVGGATSAGASGAAKTLSDNSNPAAIGPQVHRGPNVLVSKPPAELIPRWEYPLLAGPPLICCFALLFRLRKRLPTGLFLEREFRRCVDRAETIGDVAQAMENLLIEKYQLPKDRDVRARTLGALRTRGYSESAVRLERLYDAADRPPEAEAIDHWKAEALALVGSLKSKPKFRVSPVASAIWLLVFASPLCADEQTLAIRQHAELLATASADFSEGKYATAEQKFAGLVDSGVHNDLLYYNLGLTYEMQGKIGPAIANYRSALRIAPEKSEYHQRLFAMDSRQTFNLPRRIIRWTFWLAWPIFWFALAWLWFRPSPSVVVIACIALILTLGSGAVRALDRYQFTKDDVAVILGPKLELRSGDGDEFEVIANRTGIEGDLASFQASRSGWSKIRLADGTAGWVRSDQLAMVGR